MSVPRKFVCWAPSDDDPSDDDEPRLIQAVSPGDAAKLHVLRDHAKAPEHDNERTPATVLVVDYESGESWWFTVKVRADLLGEEAEP